MLRYVLKRLALFVPTLLIVSIFISSMIHLIPGDPVLTILGPRGATSPEKVEWMRRELGLDKPFHIQYLVWLWGVLHGDLGRSLILRGNIEAGTGTPVFDVIATALPPTLYLAAAAVGLSTILSIPAGVISAMKRKTSVGYVTLFFSQVGTALPSFFVGILFILVFGVYLGWFPALGYVDPTGNFPQFLRYLALPAFTLAVAYTAFMTGIARSSMLEVLGFDYVRTARSKGLAERVVVFKHALRNALIPIVTVVGLNVGSLLGGIVVIENVFSWPGMGRMLIMAIFNRDYPVVQGIILVFAFMFVAVNLIVDLVYTFVDPRIRYE